MRSPRFALTFALALLVLASTSGLFGQQIPARPAAPPAPGMPGAPPTGTQPNAQPAGKATSLIIGKVVDADSGRPIDGAVVMLGGQGRGGPAGGGPVPLQVLQSQAEPPAPPPQVFTDGQGRFLFRGLTKGPSHDQRPRVGLPQRVVRPAPRERPEWSAAARRRRAQDGRHDQTLALRFHHRQRARRNG